MISFVPIRVPEEIPISLYYSMPYLGMQHHSAVIAYETANVFYDGVAIPKETYLPTVTLRY